MELPQSFKYKTKEVTNNGNSTTIYASLHSLEESDQEYSRLNRTKWIVGDSAPNLKLFVHRQRLTGDREPILKTFF